MELIKYAATNEFGHTAYLLAFSLEGAAGLALDELPDDCSWLIEEID